MFLHSCGYSSMRFFGGVSFILLVWMFRGTMFDDVFSSFQLFIILYFPDSSFLLSFYPYDFTELLALSGSFEFFRVAMFEGVRFWFLMVWRLHHIIRNKDVVYRLCSNEYLWIHWNITIMRFGRCWAHTLNHLTWLTTRPPKLTKVGRGPPPDSVGPLL